MRKRSQVKGGSGQSTECFLHGKFEGDDCPECEGKGSAQPVAGAYCGDCGQPQAKTKHGMVCRNGHGGAATVTKQEATKILSRDLKGAMEEERRREDAPAPNPLVWDSANRRERPTVDPAFQAIVTTLFVDDPKATYDRLEKALVVGDKRTDYGSMMEHLDRAERNARDAHRLWQTAIVEYKRWEMDSEVTFAGMRSQASRSLQDEKEKGVRSKQITDADVEARIASLYPDEWRAQQSERAKLKAMLASMENLAEVWLSRCKTLQVLLSKQR